MTLMKKSKLLKFENNPQYNGSSDSEDGDDKGYDTSSEDGDDDSNQAESCDVTNPNEAWEFFELTCKLKPDDITALKD